MSEVQTRGSAPRGRGGFRGGRGGYRGSRGAKSHTGNRADEQDHSPSLEDQGEVGELKAKYADKLPMMREVCEGWSDEDLVFALQETNGDEVAAMDRITSGTISQWGEVKKKEPKAKHSASATTDSSSRGRGRGGIEGRGRGRGAERGARTGRGQRAASQANGTKHTDKSAKSTDEGWGESTATNGDATVEDWANEPGKNKLDSLETEQPKPASAAAPSGKGAWASLFAKPPPAPAPATKAEPAAAPEPIVQETSAPEIPVTEPEASGTVSATEGPDEEQALPAPPPIEPIPVDEDPSELPSAPHSDIAPNDLAPAGDELTKENVNKLPDASHPLASATVASTVASTQDPLNPALPNIQAIRPGMSGHAASALRATTGGTGRSASYSRKVAEQQEAVVMPGNHAVDRTAVQFGKMGLEADDLDADEDREEPETRTQLPDDSPAAPRASLPPAASEHKQSTQATPHETPAEPVTQQQPPGLSSASQAAQEPSPQHDALPDQYRYGQGQKSYDPFSQQPPHSQGPSEPFSNQLPGQSQAHPNVSQQEAYQQYYGREYGQYYGYGQGQGQSQSQVQDTQRSGSAFGTAAQDIPGQYASSQRAYGSQDLASGNNTPNPHPAHQTQPSAHMQQGPNAHSGYPYGQYSGNYGSGYPQYGSYGSMGHNAHGSHQGGRYGASRPMFDDVRRQQDDYYNNQYQYSHNQGYSGSYGKSGMYSGPQQHQYSHEYSSSPGNAAFAGREGYGRAGSTQPSDGQQSTTTGSNAYGGSMPDPFGRTSSGFGQSQHGAHSGSEDPAKPTGPSPSLQGNRPGSAAQTMTGQQQSGLPHPQGGQQQAFAGYPQYGGFGNQNAQHSAYGGYGSNNAFAGYGAGYGGRNWSGQQQYSSQH